MDRLIPSLSAHDLLRISGGGALICLEQPPLWVDSSLRRAPFVVVRRAASLNGMIPVGVRGSSRKQRFAAYLAPQSVVQQIAPERLTKVLGLLSIGRFREIPALTALANIEARLAKFSLAHGPTGSIGFELASGLATATSASDLDLLIRAPERLPIQSARDLMTRLGELPCRIDVQLETPYGAVSLAEYVRGERLLLLRQSGGPVLVADPWYGK
jgi:phosphoribosyl-dephospho-CoA transferase